MGSWEPESGDVEPFPPSMVQGQSPWSGGPKSDCYLLYNNNNNDTYTYNARNVGVYDRMALAVANDHNHKLSLFRRLY